MSTDVSVVILTYNEEQNLAQAVGSVKGWAREVFVLDSFSTDETVARANALGCVVQQHPFVDYGRQRNHALDHLPIQTEWVLFLDADEWVPEALRGEIIATVARRPEENGFFLSWKLIWMGKWIRRGYFPTWILRLFRFGKARCEERSVNEHLRLEGQAGYLREPFIHEDKKGLSRWVMKHDQYARREAEEMLRAAPQDQVPGRLFGTQAERVRWIREHVWKHLPLLVRPFGYFGYRYFLRMGFLDGKEALVFHLLQSLWFPLLIDAYYLELRGSGAVPESTRSAAAPPAAGPREPPR